MLVEYSVSVGLYMKQLITIIIIIIIINLPKVYQ